MSLSLNGHVALVTGGSSGIGAAIARKLASRGADVVIHHFKDAQRADAMRNDILDAGVACHVLEGNLADDGAGMRLVKDAVALGQSPDIIVSNVAVQVMSDWAEINSSDIETQWQVNYRAALDLTQAAVPLMQAGGWGRVLYIGSVQQRRPHPEMLIYSSLKAAQEAMMRSLARTVAASNVTLNMLAPGVVMTDRTRAALDDPEQYRRTIAEIPAGYIADPDDMSEAAAYLVSPAARYVTGQTLFVDGGMGL